MDSGLSVKPTASVAPMSDVRSEIPVRSAVATELAAPKSVTAPPETSRSTSSADSSRVREIVLDPHSREVIYRVVDVRSRRVVRQIPEEAMLRLRAYARETLEKNETHALQTTV